MSNLVTFDIADPGPSRDSLPAADRVVEGNPTFKTWEKESLDGGRVRSGIWEATPGAYRSIKGDNWEYCTILSGLVELTEDGGAPIRLAAGDTFVMRPGFTGTWKTIETVRKLWVVVS
jgi:uncharacterized cupin superfamily protein